MDIWETIKKAVGKFAPVIGNAIVPGVGGMAGGLIAKALGVENEPGAIIGALASATPEQLKAIKDSENKHEERLLEIGKDVDKLFLQDRQDARQREVDIVKATGSKDINLYILAWAVVIGFFVLIGMMMFIELPSENVGPINQLFGALQLGFGLVLAYFFGTSAGSAMKTKIMSIAKGK